MLIDSMLMLKSFVLSKLVDGVALARVGEEGRKSRGRVGTRPHILRAGWRRGGLRSQPGCSGSCGILWLLQEPPHPGGSNIVRSCQQVPAVQRGHLQQRAVPAGVSNPHFVCCGPGAPTSRERAGVLWRRGVPGMSAPCGWGPCFLVGTQSMFE